MLQTFYAAYFVAVAVTMAFFPPYLRMLGLSGRAVSAVLAVGPVLHMGLPLVWGWLADRTRRPDRVLRLCCLGAFLFILPLMVVRTMPGLLLVYAVQQSFNVAIISLVDSLALERVRTAGGEYGRIRFWGSLAFAIATALIGPALASGGALALVPALLASAFGVTLLASLGLRGHGAERERPHARDLRLLLADRRFLFLLIVAPLHWACSGPYNAFFAILLGDRGLSPAVVGQAFTVSVIGELVVLYFFRRLRTVAALPRLMALSFAGSSVRWWAVGRSHDAVVLVALQGLHALTFGLFWGCALAWLSECVAPRLRATGQAMFTAATFGVGSVVGILGSGFLYDATGSATAAFEAAALLNLVPLALALAAGRRLEPR